jgi:hypothetical protein
MVREVLVRAAPVSITGDGIKLDEGLTGFWDTKAPDAAFLKTFTKAVPLRRIALEPGRVFRYDLPSLALCQSHRHTTG